MGWQIEVVNAACSRRGGVRFLLMWLGMGLLGLSSGIQAQWSTQSPVPTNREIRGIAAPAPGRVFLATDNNGFDNNGALLESQDGGSTWTRRNVPVNLASGLNGMTFFDANYGWVYGNINYRTTDGGTTWAEIPALGSTYGMTFHTPVFGLASGNFGNYVSADGGLSWQPSPNTITDFAFSDSQNGLGIAVTGIYRTADGGANFARVDSGFATDVVFLDGSNALAIIEGQFSRSGDGGTTWTRGVSAEGRNRLVVVSANTVLAWGRSGTFPNYDDRVFHSQDGGQTWTDLGEIASLGTLAITVADPQTLVLADGEGNLFHSGDAGLNWTQTFSSPGPRPGFLSSAVPVFENGQNGYFGFGGGFVIKTTDGGITWSQISSGTSASLSDVAAFPDGKLIAVGADGIIVTSSGQSPWTMAMPLTGADLVAVQVLDGETVLALDETGQLFGSSDTGATWFPTPGVPTGLNAEALHFTSAGEGWIAGSGSIGNSLFKTTDGGTTWSGIPDFGGAYIAVDAIGTHIWAANVGGIFYASADNGSSWTQGTLPGSPFQIRDMDFYDESTGYAVGWGGYAARSSDGGLSWEVLPTPNTDDHLTDIYLLGSNELWVSTTDNVAYYSATGGQNWAVLNINSDGFGNFSAIAANETGDAWVVGDQGYIEFFSGPPPPPLNQPPSASFDFVARGMSVNFTDTSSDRDGVIVSWSWDFGDGTTSAEQNPTHAYTVPNTYIVRLTVTDDDGESTTAGRAIVAQPGPGGTFGDFTEVTPYDSLFVTPQNEDFWVIATAPADYDNDGDLDIAVLGYYVVYNQSVRDRLVLVRNDGPAGAEEWEFAYIDVPLGNLSASASDLAWGDVDGDGDQDLAVGSDGETVLYRNDAGNLVLTDTQLPGYWEDNDQADFDLHSLSWADFDNDGDQDLLIPSVFSDSTFSFRTALMRNDGSNGSGGWIFTETDSVFAPTIHAQSAWADFDNDQDLDLLLVHIAPLTDDGFIRRYRNDGNGVWTGEDILGDLTVEHGEAQWGDYDADGDLDILVAGHLKEPDGSFTVALRIYRNDNDTFIPVEVIDCVPCDGWFDLTAASWGDYDSDGDMDILLAGTYNSGTNIEGRARVYTNTGGTFTDSGNDLPAPRASGSRGGTFSWLDIDGEGDLDYFIAGQYFVPGGNGLVEAQMHVYRNDVAGQNDAPTAPANLSATVGADGVVQLSWDSAADDHTPAAALTYDLEIYLDGAPVNLPRRLPEPGNLSAVNQWVLGGLAEGSYEWKLRAVDAAFAGGESATGTFSVGNPNGVDPIAAIPLAYSLEPNYPNPFNPSTSLRFTLPERAEVSLTVYNISGQVVQELVNGTREAGLHEVRWEAANFASGVYFVRLSTPRFTSTRKVTLMK